MNRIALFASLGLLASCFSVAAPSAPPDLILEGKVSGVQNKTYFEVPFDVPEGVHRISVDFSYTGRDHKTTLDLGIADPYRFRGNSGGNKSHFTVSETDATPSYLPGAIPAGKWKLLISVPNIRPAEEVRYRAEVRFNAKAEDESFASAPLAEGKRWYRGDLHMHTAHSDGSCASQSGKRSPCPLFLTAQAAASRGLDFIAITDHNTESHYGAMRELQPYFDRLLLIPGREITTFWGHFNIFGVTDYIDYRTQAHGGRDVNDILRDVRTRGGIASVNHADAPGGEVCMGCAWEPPRAVDMSLFTGVETVNGGNLISTDFWDRQLAKGLQLTAIGGSDNHNALLPAGGPNAIGRPTTVVEADELSVPAILDSMNRGRVFIDLTASYDKMIDMEARDETGVEKWTLMGDALKAVPGHAVSFRVLLASCPHSQVHFLLDGHETSGLAPMSATVGNETLTFRWSSDGGYHWLRCEVRDADGNLLLMSNPVYINLPSH
jgi:hypothetical protein